MAINNVSWPDPSQATATKMTNMVSDETNSTDNIHPQYVPAIYNSCTVNGSWTFGWKDSESIFFKSYKIFNLTEQYHVSTLTATPILPLVNITALNFKKFGATGDWQWNTLNWAIDAWPKSATTDFAVYFSVDNTDLSSNIGSTVSKTGIEFTNGTGDYTSFSGTVDISTVPSDDIVEAAIGIDFLNSTPAGSDKILWAQNVKLYLS